MKFGKKEVKNMKRKLLVPLAALLLVVCFTMALLYEGVIHINNPSRTKYPILGLLSEKTVKTKRRGKLSLRRFLLFKILELCRILY